jgi:predicted ATP-grasp superfamily ATP-dependent carboligase
MHHAPAHQIDNWNDQHARLVKIFVYEHITGGGCAGTPLPPALLPEAALMLRALVGDLLPCADVFSLRDARVENLRDDWPQRLVHDHAQWQEGFDALVRHCDAAWLIAPETEYMLERLSSRVLAAGKPLLGSRPHAISIAARKLATSLALDNAGVAVVRTSWPVEFEGEGACVAKPDDGCGCEETRKFAHRADALAWISMHPERERLVLQPYVSGEPISLSVLASATRVRLLSVNRQRIELRDGIFSLSGCIVNAICDADGALLDLAERAIGAIPGLWGYVGIDALLTQHGPVVLEVNPRLTTSYAGLRDALGINPARLVLDLLHEREQPFAPLPRGRAIEVSVRDGKVRESALT